MPTVTMRPHPHWARGHALAVNVTAWAVGSIIVTALWVAHEWQANGAFERFAHEGNTGDWNPTLPALVVVGWGFVVAVLALRRHFATAEAGAPGRLTFHIAAWALGVPVLAALNVLIEWQDNGGFERLSRNSQPGSWDPWGLIVSAGWAVVLLLWLVVPAAVARRRASGPRGPGSRDEA